MIHLIFQALKILQKLIFKLYENMTMKNIELTMITMYVQLKQYFAVRSLIIFSGLPSMDVSLLGEFFKIKDVYCQK